MSWWRAVRRFLCTRCAWCGGKHVYYDPVDHWALCWPPPGRWWQAEQALFHRDCASFAAAHAVCLCDPAVLVSGDRAPCASCGKHRTDDPEPVLDAYRLLATLPIGVRDVWAYSRFRLKLMNAGAGGRLYGEVSDDL